MRFTFVLRFISLLKLSSFSIAKRIKIGARWTIFFMISETQMLEGITSLQKNGLHYPMWDIEDCNEEQMEMELTRIQDKYKLSHIFVLSDHEKSYRAFTTDKITLAELLYMLLDSYIHTRNIYGKSIVCWDFIRFTQQREKATIRISKKENRMEQPIMIILSPHKRMDEPNKEWETVLYETGIEKIGLKIVLDKGHSRILKQWKHKEFIQDGFT